MIYLSGCDLWVSSHLTLTKSPWQRKDVTTSASQICCGVTCTKIWQIGAPEQCRSFIWTNSISYTMIYIYSSVNFLFKNYCLRKMSGCKSCKNILSGKIKLQFVNFSVFFLQQFVQWIWTSYCFQSNLGGAGHKIPRHSSLEL